MKITIQCKRCGETKNKWARCKNCSNLSFQSFTEKKKHDFTLLNMTGTNHDSALLKYHNKP